ncbi:MAG: hypothetical protein NTZ36_01750 [Candidatus Jorgensenbacteria bacterium]|nr:hypothetical protein [Candidatus Jorgensenbacteria bacterium]
MELINKIKFRISRRIVFTIMALIMVVLVGVFVVSQMTKLTNGLNKSFSTSESSSAPEKFDIQGFEALKLPKS